MMLDAWMDADTGRETRSSALRTEKSLLFQPVTLTNGIQGVAQRGLKGYRQSWIALP